MKINNKVGDLTAMCKEIEQVMRKHLKLKEKPGICIAFTCEHTDFEEAHWVLNIPREDAVSILRGCADRLTTNSN